MFSFKRATLAVAVVAAGFVTLGDPPTAEAGVSPRTLSIYSVTMYWHHPQRGSYTTAAHVGVKWQWTGRQWRQAGYTGVGALRSHVLGMQRQGYRIKTYRHTFMRNGTW